MRETYKTTTTTLELVNAKLHKWKLLRAGDPRIELSEADSIQKAREYRQTEGKIKDMEEDYPRLVPYLQKLIERFRRREGLPY